MTANQPNPAQQASDAFAVEEMKQVAIDLDDLAKDGWICAQVAANFIRHVITPVEPAARELTAAQGETVTVQEAWGWAGGNPGIKPTRDELKDALEELDKVCDEADTLSQPTEPQGAVAGDLEIAEAALQRFHDKFMERAHIDPSTNYPEYGSQEDYYTDICAALEAVKELQDVPADPRETGIWDE